MKKFLTLILALALVMSLSVPVFAAGDSYNQNDTGGQTDLTFTYDPASPTYTVTIPGSLTLAIGDNNLPIAVSDTDNLGGKKVTVTFEETQDYSMAIPGYFLNLATVVDLIGYTITYKLFDADNHDVTYDYSGYNSVLEGTVLAEFTTDGTKNIKINIPSSAYTVGTYTGYIVFGIYLV